jgi:aspartyl-tRNA synthetase
MVAGFDKYYQIAKCFRDEGMRSDRQPEFTQLDMEMSFVSQEQIMQTMESLIKHLWKSHKAEYATDTDNSVLITDSPFERISYDEAMRLYGSDKPDLRFQGKIAFSMTVTGDPSINHVLEGLLLKGRGRSSHNRDESNEFCLPIEGLKSKEILRTFSQGHSDGTLAKWHGNDLTKCPFVSKHETDAILNRLEGELGLNVGPRDCLLVQKRDVNANVGLTCLGRARLAALQTLLAEGNCETGEADKFLWVHSFPLLTRASPESCAQNPLRRFDSMHHPFTAPLDDHALTDTTNDSQLLQLRAQHYDLVLNGQEIGGGSVRIHDANFQEFLMSSILGLSPQQIGHFSHLLRALKLGAPPHAGMALGLDRIVAILAKKQSIREVIAFPKNSTGFDLCFKAPS